MTRMQCPACGSLDTKVYPEDFPGARRRWPRFLSFVPFKAVLAGGPDVRPVLVCQACGANTDLAPSGP
jgi:hypothetical protein